MATLFFRNNTNVFNLAANWSLTSGGGATGTLPTATDDIVFDANSGPCLLSVTTGLCKTFTSTNYTNTFTMSVPLNVSGNITLGTGHTITGTSGFVINAAATLTSNGYVLPVLLTLFGAFTFTLADIWTLNANFTSISYVGGTQTINGFQFNFMRNGIFSGNQTSITTGTTVFRFLGTGTGTSLWQHLTNMRNNVIIDCGSNIFSYSGAGTGSNLYTLGTIKYISGVSGTLTIGLNLGTCTLDWSGATNYINFPIIWSGTPTITLLSDVYIGQSTGTAAIISGSYSVYISGSYSSGISNAVSVIMSGTGTISGSITSNFIINTSGTYTISAAAVIQANITFTYTAGTVIATFGLNIQSPCTINANGIIFPSITVSATTGSTITLTSTLNVTGTMSLATYTFAGPAGFSVGNLTLTGTLTLTSGNIYNVNNILTANGSGTRVIIQSSVAGVVAKLNLKYGATQSSSFVTITDIDSSDGQTIWSYSPIFSNAINWNSFTYLNMQSFSGFC